MNPVNLAHRKAKACKQALELYNVVAPEHGNLKVQQSCSKTMTCFDKLLPSLGAANTVDIDRAPGLKSLKCIFRINFKDSARLF